MLSVSSAARLCLANHGILLTRLLHISLYIWKLLVMFALRWIFHIPLVCQCSLACPQTRSRSFSHWFLVNLGREREFKSTDNRFVLDDKPRHVMRLIYRVSVLCVPKLWVHCVKTFGDKPILFIVYCSGIYGNFLQTNFIEFWALLIK